MCIPLYFIQFRLAVVCNLRTACADVRYEIHKQTDVLLLVLLLHLLRLLILLISLYTYAGREHVMAMTTSASAGDQSQIKLKHNFWPSTLSGST